MGRICTLKYWASPYEKEAPNLRLSFQIIIEGAGEWLVKAHFHISALPPSSGVTLTTPESQFSLGEWG